MRTRCCRTSKARWTASSPSPRCQKADHRQDAQPPRSHLGGGLWRAPERSLRERAEAVRDELLTYPQITQVDLGGVRPYEIAIEISEENLRRYNLTLEQVAQRVRRASLDLPGGSHQDRRRGDSAAHQGAALLRSGIRRPGDGGPSRRQPGPPARYRRVRDTFQETDTFATFDGKPAAMVKVYRVGDTETDGNLRSRREVHRGKIADPCRRRCRSPPGRYLGAVRKPHEPAAEKRRLRPGPVLIVLGLFLEIRLALWVMLGIPISFLGTLFLMPALGMSINMISLSPSYWPWESWWTMPSWSARTSSNSDRWASPFLQAAIDGRSGGVGPGRLLRSDHGGRLHALITWPG